MKRGLFYRYRYLIVLAVFILCLLLRVSGSSIGWWSQLLGSADTQVIGTSRDIRTDEWGMLTAMCLAQEHNPAGAYERYAPIGDDVVVDQGIVYALPSRDLLAVFRPFYWGYLLFGSEIGLSWYWCGRFLALFVSMFELGMMITKKDRALSLFLSVCVCFAPFVQWWYAVNGLVEMLIYGAVFLLGLSYLLSGKGMWKRLAAAVSMAVSAVGYVLTFYPAWMAPIAYGFLPVFIWILYEHRKGLRFGENCNKIIVSDRSAGWQMVMPWLLCGLMICGGLFYLFVTSEETIKAVLGSAYPGRSDGSTGGGVGFWLLKYPFSLSGVRTDDPSVIENSSVICFAPIGFIISLWVMIKNKKADRLLLLLLGVEMFLTWFYCFGTEGWIAKCLLLSFTNAHRGAQVIGFLRLFVLVRALCCKKHAVKRLPSAVTAVAAAGFAVWISWCFTQYDSSVCQYEYWENELLAVAVFAVLSVVFFLFLRYESGKKYSRYGSLLTAGAVVFAVGVSINPIRFGTDVITESEVYQAVNQIAEENPDAVWVEIGIDYPASNLVAMAGGNCLTTSQTYPVLERWEIFGTEEEQVEVYNRYCHIRAVLGTDTACTLLQADYVQMELNDEALLQLSVDYVLTKYTELQIPSDDEWGVDFELISQCGEYFIYRCRQREAVLSGL